MPFSTACTRKPTPEMERGMLQWHWRCRALWQPEDWSLDVVATHDGQVIGARATPVTIEGLQHCLPLFGVG